MPSRFTRGIAPSGSDFFLSPPAVCPEPDTLTFTLWLHGCARELFVIRRYAQTAASKTENCEFMKRNLIIALALILGGGILCAGPYRLTAADTASAAKNILYYTCSMHPSVKLNKPGDCPICGMSLRPVYIRPTGTNAPPVVSTNQPVATLPACCSPGSGCR